MMRSLIVAAAASLTAHGAVADNVASQISLPTPWDARDGAVIDFTVLRQGKPFGSHVLRFSRDQEGDLEVVSDVDLDVKFGPITAFIYRLDAKEEWRDGRLLAVNGQANNDGRKAKVVARAVGDMLAVDGSKFDGQVPGTMIPSSHWNIMQVYSDRMLSTETGEILDIDVDNLGPEAVQVGDTAVEATRYRLKSDISVDLWYDDQSRWVKLAFETNGQSIEYVLNSLY